MANCWYPVRQVLPVRRRKHRYRRPVLAVVGVASVMLMVVWYLLIHRVEGSFVVLEGVPIHYTTEGEGEPVVLLHGFAVNADLNWRLVGITERLATEFRVIAVDQRGHGLSGKPHEPASYGMELVAA